jgi:hypothetical protein
MKVCIGGFHVSGCIAMLPEMPEEMREAAALGISFFAGEAGHGRLDQVIQDPWAGKLRPLYNFMNDLPALEGEPAPISRSLPPARTNSTGSISTMRPPAARARLLTSAARTRYALQWVRRRTPRSPADRNLAYRTATGATVEPVPPWILSGSMMKANSLTFLAASSSSFRFSKRCTPFITSAIW